MAKNVILGPPSKSTGSQNGTQNRTFAQKGRKQIEDALHFWCSWKRLAPQRPHEAFRTPFGLIWDAFRLHFGNILVCSAAIFTVFGASVAGVCQFLAFNHHASTAGFPSLSRYIFRFLRMPLSLVSAVFLAFNHVLPTRLPKVSAVAPRYNPPTPAGVRRCRLNKLIWLL